MNKIKFNKEIKARKKSNRNFRVKEYNYYTKNFDRALHQCTKSNRRKKW